MNQVTQDLRVMAAVVGISGITEGTAAEFWARANLVQHIGGSVSRRRLLSMDDVRGNVGLQADARTMTRDEFFTELRENLLEPMLVTEHRAYERRQQS